MCSGFRHPSQSKKKKKPAVVKVNQNFLLEYKKFKESTSSHRCHWREAEEAGEPLVYSLRAG